jgi:dipeptidyl-peptidase 4
VKFQNAVKLLLSILVVISVLSSAMLQAQGTTADYQRAEKFLRKNVEKRVFQDNIIPRWIEKTSRFWFKNNTREGKKFMLADCRKGSLKPAFNHERMAKALSLFLEKEYEAYKLPFDSIEFLDKGKAVTFNVEKQKIKCSLKSYKCEKIEEEKKDPMVSVSPDEKWEAFVRKNNLYVKSRETGKETQLTTDGADKFVYGLQLGWYYKMNESDPSQTKKMESISVEWSKDSKKLVTHRLDYRNAKKLYLYQSLPKSGYRAQVWSYYRALPGEKEGSMVEYFIFDIPSKKKIRIDIKPLHDTISWGSPTFFKDGKRLYYSHYTRGYKKLILLEIDAETGKTRTVVDEASETYMDTDKQFTWIMGEGKEVLWSSERDGWAHLYLYDWKTGKLKNQVTRGEYVVRRVVHVDEKKRQVYFTAGGREAGRDPYLQHLYRVNLDGSGLKLLTPENAEHWIRLSGDKKYIVDSYSRVDLPTGTVIRRLRDGKVIRKVATADFKDLQALGWKFPEPFKVKARDGKTDIYGVIFRPTNFDPNKKYPVIDGTYSGPQAVRTPKSFRQGYWNLDQPLAELGFIVVTVDGLGTANRSKAFHHYSYKNLGDIGALDHIAAIKQLAEKYPYMDISRVGIYGHSAGGYDTAHALLTHPEFYKVGVSSAGNHDHQMAKAWWPEHYMGYPVGKHYVEQSNLTLAKNLKGKLLLIHGDMDNNVNPASTLRFTAALVKADRDFDLVIIPNRSHGLSDHPYYLRKLWDYFTEHLLGVEPPKYTIKTYENK